MKLKSLITESSWQKQLEDEWQKPYIEKLENFLQAETDILPAQDEWFNALNSLPFTQIKVIILGQDPYPTEGHAHGLSFSVKTGVSPLPKSLLNINKELLNDLNINNQHTGNLQHWNNQGVLLLNTVLTVQKGNANAHQKHGWEQLTDKIIQQISDQQNHCVFILWGANAQKKSMLINPEKHHIIKTPHPSPLSAYRGFWGSKPFSKTNLYLEKNNLQPIDWQLPSSAIT